MKENYGNVGNILLIDVLQNINFNKKWGIKKSEIETCNVCEFRKVCTDCRAYLKEEHLFSKPAKCNYDPFTAVWKK